MVLLGIRLLSLLLCVAIALAQTRSQKVCDVSTRLCFEGIHESSTNTTLGFILPPKSKGHASENLSLIGMLSFPLPYGFSGFSFGETNPDSFLSKRVSSINSLMIVFFAFPPRSDLTAASDFVAPLATHSSSKAALLPSSANLTISSKSTVSSDRATLLFTCNACIPPTDSAADIFTSDNPKLTLFLQDEKPICPPGDKLTDVILPLPGAESSQFVLDTNAARSSRFSEFLRMLE